jgi:hypothetical protein
MSGLIYSGQPLECPPVVKARDDLAFCPFWQVGRDQERKTVQQYFVGIP